MNMDLAPRSGHSPSRSVLQSRWAAEWAGAAALGACLCGPALAQDVAALTPRAESMNSLLGRIGPAETRSSPSPVAFERSRLLEDDRSLSSSTGLDARGRPSNEVAGVSYRWWMRNGAANFGVGLGTIGYVVPSDNAASFQSLSYRSSVLSVGWRYQVAPRSTLFADASGARRFSEDTADRISTKVGVEWKASSNKFGLDGASRSLAFQLDSGYRMSLKVRRNGIGVYVKGQF